jgi:signal peptidase I
VIEERKIPWTKSLLRYLRLLLIALALALVIKVGLLEAYRIPSESMRNTLQVGDFLLADKCVYGPRIPFLDIRLPSVHEPRVGDVVVFRRPDDQQRVFIKRIIAEGGQQVEIVDKKVFVDGGELDESDYIIHSDPHIFPRTALQPRDNFGPLRVPRNHYFVLGDNRDNSSDSRYWGCVPRELVIGKAFLIHWSWQPDPLAPRPRLSKPLSLLSYFAYNVSHLPDRVRWGRLFSEIN